MLKMKRSWKGNWEDLDSNSGSTIYWLYDLRPIFTVNMLHGCADFNEVVMRRDNMEEIIENR